MLSARNVEEALRDRILRGAHPPGGPLPTVRTLAAELGASPSTVGRAIQELARQGWLRVTNRRGTVVSRELPDGETGERALEAAVRRLAVRWRLAGGDRDSFGKLVGQVADEVFRPAPRLLFLECNPVDLRRGLEQLQRDLRLGDLPARPPLMLAFPSALEPGWAPAAWPRCGCRPSCRGGPPPGRGRRACWSAPPTTPGGSRSGPSAPSWSRSSGTSPDRWSGSRATAPPTPTPTTWR
jgi:DNA-binding transcriptional regulator YhcF (GntR family)